jgi:hypothetical protein
MHRIIQAATTVFKGYSSLDSNTKATMACALGAAVTSVYVVNKMNAHNTLLQHENHDFVRGENEKSRNFEEKRWARQDAELDMKKKSFGNVWNF